MNLKSLCSPVLALMRRLSYGRLFTLVGIVLLSPLLYLQYLQWRGAQDSVVFNQKESYGVENIVPARELVQQAARQRVLLAAQARGENGFSAELQAQRSRLREITSRLDRVTKRLGPSIPDLTGEQKTVVKLKDVVAQMQAYETAETGGGDTDKALTALLAVTNDFVLNYVGNFSNLILDPDLDSYYLMDAYTARLGSLTETLVNIGHLVISRTEAGVLTEADRLLLAGHVARARSFASDLKTNFETSFANNANGRLRPSLGATVDTAIADVNAFVAMIETQSLGKERSTMTPGEFCKHTTSTIDSVQRLHEEVGPQLDSLIVDRVNRYSNAQMTGLATGLLAVVLILYVLLSFYFQVSTELTGKIKEADSLRTRAESENQLLNGNIMELLSFVANCADGDLTGRAKVTEGALGNVADALNQMMDNWTEVLGTLIKTIEETQNAGQKVGETAASMAQGATAQAQKLDAATAAVHQIRGDITHVSENAATAVTAASRTQESAFSGAEMVQKIAEEMETLRANVQAGAKKIKNLGDRSMEITGIVGTIAKISEQTNMLALNAAIDAARAGEHGRGFSVVAEEVRKLAERTSMATQDIRTLITSIQAETSESVAAIEEQTRAVEHHADSVTESGQVLQKIQRESTQTSELITDMNRIARDQVPAAEQTLQGMLAVSEIAKETQSSAQTALKLSKALGQSADRLVTAIGSFRIAR
ncbi:MAG: methyl-accepting chemotaxis protein [Planctomycetota bacterium]